MNTDKSAILIRIKKAFKDEVKKPNNIRLPRDIDFTITENNVEIHIASKYVERNMQEDGAAFEGWALVLKRWGKFEKVILSWDLPASDTNGHYQRFLFRVYNFAKDFKNWFSIQISCLPLLTTLMIIDTETYYLSLPYNNRDREDLQGTESKLEYAFSKGAWANALKSETNAKYLNRQLPVGIFTKPVSKLTSIFPRNKSAIDIWGISIANELLLFELKADNNNKVGIITELYFYSCIMKRVQSGLFKHELTKLDLDMDMIAKSKGIIAYLFAPELHLLIDSELAKIVNDGVSPSIEFKYLKFDAKKDNLVLEDGFNSSNP
ncbi:MAG: hypothetical protein WCJ95_13975 [Mariniphaga sp.]